MPPTATTTTQPPPPPPSPPPAAVGSRSIRRRATATSTPARLALLRAVVIVLALVFAVGGAFGVNRRANAIDDVRSSAAQLLALQDIRVRVVHADAIASSSYLVGGQEDPAQRTAYLDEIAKAGDGLVAVSAAATPTDLVQLSEASRLLGNYVGLVEQARANNRQGFPVGAAYQRQANGIVSNNDSRRARHRLVAARRRGVAARPDQRQPGHGPSRRCVAAVARMGAARGSRARQRVDGPQVPPTRQRPDRGRSRRAVSAAADRRRDQGRCGQRRRCCRQGSLASADNAAQARAAAFEARSQEALTLINRGNGAANEANWQRGNNIVTRVLDKGLGTDAALSDACTVGVRDVQGRPRRDSGARRTGQLGHGRRHQPRAARTPTAINAVDAFDKFDQAVGQIVDRRGRQRIATPRRRGLRRCARCATSCSSPVSCVAALAALGCGQRLKEYR